jgi:hypothetical protein
MIKRTMQEKSCCAQGMAVSILAGSYLAFLDSIYVESLPVKVLMVQVGQVRYGRYLSTSFMYVVYTAACAIETQRPLWTENA